jgi:hypothetical protein
MSASIPVWLEFAEEEEEFKEAGIRYRQMCRSGCHPIRTST